MTKFVDNGAKFWDEDEMMMVRWVCLTGFFFLVFLSAIAVAADGGPEFRLTQKPGPHPVGLKVVNQYDYSRTYRYATDELGKPYQGERARPIQTLVWYPALRSAAKPMTVNDYAQLSATETRFDHPQLSPDMREWLAGARDSLTTSLRAVRDAPLAAARFPVVIYAPGAGGPSWENADLCEYLASYGYVVIASPDRGAITREMTFDVAGINTLARDISFLINYAQTLPDTDMTSVAVVGHSWGGIANVFAAARDRRIDALVTLDGSLRYYPALVKQAGDVHPEQLTIPLLALLQAEFSLEDQDRYITAGQLDGPSVLNAWTHGDLITAHMLGLVHRNFTSKWQRDIDAWTDYPQSAAGDYGREDGITAYGWVARYTRAFLDGYLKHDTASMTFLRKTPAENGVPRHVMTVNYRLAEGMPVSFESFLAEVGRQGFDHASDVYAAFQKRKADFKLDVGALTDWTDELIGDNHLAEAIALLKLNVQMNPDSDDAYLRLGDAYALSGQRQQATVTYRVSLEKDRSGSQAGRVRRKLRELQQ
jgi:dienelactone hydrolase